MDEKRWRTTAIFWSILLIFAALTFFYNLVEVKTLANTANLILLPDSSPKENTFIEETLVKGYVIKTPGCTIPDLKPMDPLIKKFVFRERPIVCNNGTPPLFDSNRTSLFLLQDSLPDYKIINTDALKCCYHYFRRKPPANDQSDKKIAYSPICYNITNSVDVDPKEQFLRVKCQYNGTDIYKDFFHFVPVEPKKESIPKEYPDETKLNVLVVGIDAVSRLNFHRQMPKTAFYLEKLNAVELLGYNKVGDNTFPNLMVALSGHTEEELQNICWPNNDAYFDDCDFVWKHYKKAGYTTAFAEDAAWMGLFYYQKMGFKRQPTDIFYGHFDIAATQEIGNNHRMNVDQCLGSRKAHEVFLNYIQNYVRTMHENEKPFFGFFWSSTLSHDFLNKPKLGDQQFLDLFFTMDEEGVLNNTALIVMSDHGIRWGDIRSTYQGRMEERLPFVFVILPAWYKEQHPEFYNNLRTNRRRLTTPHDLHATFLHLLNDSAILSKVNSKSAKHPKAGISLFEEVPKNRTCTSAGIETHWCTCQTSMKIRNDNEDVIKSVNYTINHINEMLVGYADCMPLTLDKINDAYELATQNDIEQYKKSARDFTVTFRTTPGGAIFEATVRKESDKFWITGTVSRLNLYGAQSKCIADFHLKLYCYCRSYLGN